jgi:hypothetical protein
MHPPDNTPRRPKTPPHSTRGLPDAPGRDGFTRAGAADGMAAQVHRNERGGPRRPAPALPEGAWQN